MAVSRSGHRGVAAKLRRRSMSQSPAFAAFKGIALLAEAHREEQRHKAKAEDRFLGKRPRRFMMMIANPGGEPTWILDP